MNPAGKNCTVTRIGRLWDAILVTDDGFGALQKCAQSQIRLGEWGGWEGGGVGGGGGVVGGGGGWGGWGGGGGGGWGRRICSRNLERVANPRPTPSRRQDFRHLSSVAGHADDGHRAGSWSARRLGLTFEALVLRG